MYTIFLVPFLLNSMRPKIDQSRIFMKSTAPFSLSLKRGKEKRERAV